MRRGWVPVVALWIFAGCGGGEKGRSSSLGFEQLPDTALLDRGKPLLTAFEPYRVGGGAMRVRGTADFPDGTRLQISIYRKRTSEMVQRVQVTIGNRRFDSPPVIGERGPLPVDDYRFELRTFFDDIWQPTAVLRATDDGRTLRGPGMTRDRLGRAVFLLEREARL